jgi:hypothetical protein
MRKRCLTGASVVSSARRRLGKPVRQRKVPESQLHDVHRRLTLADPAASRL